MLLSMEEANEDVVYSFSYIEMIQSLPKKLTIFTKKMKKSLKIIGMMTIFSIKVYLQNNFLLNL
ncbi:Uncharacterised protein [Streptococcus pneumoniae]|nr:Uncharacterised protein [Streptococcus pneumoniae]VLR91957.1 Uncharacterised protein [Streptococcus pneumoniae]VRO58214.1 Uncharacterised protein [Streptococcus pneumoniae]